MNETGSELMLKVAHLEAKLASYELLLAQVSKTCGQNNCNCPNSDKVKKLARDLNGEQNITSGRR
jgi:hypothetical protein